MKPIKRTVDDRLPKWLHSKILSAVDFIWLGKKESVEESLKRVAAVDASLTDEEMHWVMMLLILPKIQMIIESLEDWIAFKRQKEKEKKESVH